MAYGKAYGTFNAKPFGRAVGISPSVNRSPISFFRDVAGRSYLIVKPNDTPTFVGPK